LLLIVVGEQRSRSFAFLGFDLVGLHQAAFLLCGIALGLHFLGRIVPALRLAFGWTPATGRRARDRVPGGAQRLTAIVATLAAAGVAAALLLPLASGWQNERFFRFDHGPHDRAFSSQH
jgi:hypothetical protein